MALTGGGYLAGVAYIGLACAWEQDLNSDVVEQYVHYAAAWGFAAGSRMCPSGSSRH